MENEETPGLDRYLTEWSEDMELLRQNWLLSESSFLTFARDRDVHVVGVVVGEPSAFHKKGWLVADRVDEDGGLWFHPFRFYAVREILGGLERKRQLESIFRRQSADDVGHDTPPLPAIEIPKVSAAANDVVDLALLLEPLYWPGITGKRRINTHSRERNPAELFRAYREKVLPLVRSLDVHAWQKIHESLRIEAARVDDNSALYLLLRLSVWDERERLKGAISGALWIRHIAEVIRRGIEEAHGVQWAEEDRAFGSWFGGAREREYGAERPLDDPLRCKPYIAFNFGLFTGSAVRWYVEGLTEYYAIEELLGQPSKIGVELIDLKGNIAAERDNAALKLEEWLKEDKKFRRFSAISFDRDVPTNVKVVRRQVEQDNIVGTIAAHDPDFEFANFTLGELADIAAGLAEDNHSSGTSIRDADWTGITSAKAFERQYAELVGRSLKGKAWGYALAAYARKNPLRSDTGKERRIMQDVAAAFRGRIASYDVQKEQFTFDPDTFETIARPAAGKQRSAG